MIGNKCDQIKPVRKIKPTRRSISGVMAFKGLGGVAFESSLERDFLKRMRFSHQVESVISQPVEVPFSDSLGRPQIYTPDYLVFYHQQNLPYFGVLRPLLVEVKPREQWVENWRAWSGKWKEARRLARSQGWQFRIYDESRIRGLALENIVFLERFERMIFEQSDIDTVLNTLREMEVAPVHYLLARHFNGIFRDRGVSLLWYLIATRQVDCDITEPLNHDLELWVPDHETV